MDASASRWSDPPLLGLTGTGLLGEYQLVQPPAGSSSRPAPALYRCGHNSQGGATATSTQVIWREVRGRFDAFGHERDRTKRRCRRHSGARTFHLRGALVTLHNGYAVTTADGERLGGASTFRVRWSGVLLVEQEGEYAFHAGAPMPREKSPISSVPKISMARDADARIENVGGAQP